MALKISGTTVVDNNKAITNVTSYSGPGVASQSEAEAGTNNDQLMTPLRVKQAIDEAMAGLSYPDISTDGWPGTDKGHAGFGGYCYYRSWNNNSWVGAGNTAIMPFGETYDPNQLQDLVTRNGPSWEFNRTANKSTTVLKPVTGYIQMNPGLAANEIHIRFPNPLGSKTLDIYLQSRTSNVSNRNDTVALQGLDLNWLSGMTTQINSPLPNSIAATVAKTRVFDGSPYGGHTAGRQQATYRYRVTSAPEATVLSISPNSGYYNSSYSAVYLHLCYYEVY